MTKSSIVLLCIHELKNLYLFKKRGEKKDDFGGESLNDQIKLDFEKVC